MSKHLKRLNAPKAMRVGRKAHHWVVKPSPGAHPLARSVALTVLLRDHLDVAETGREAKSIIARREVKIDGRPVTDPSFAVGLMDVISIDKTDEHFRMGLDRHGRLTPLRISKEDAAWKLCRVEDARTLPGGIQQYNLHDGRNLQSTKSVYTPGDTLRIEIPEQKVVATYPFKEGATALIISGTHTGQLARVASHEVVRSSFPDIVKFKEGLSTIKPNVFVVGADKSEIAVAEEAVL
jgi:small subunit ribosomal protein S4e